MIVLTKLDRNRILVSLENIKYVESTPDTLVRFVNGDMLLVLETLDEIGFLVEQFKARCLQLAVPGQKKIETDYVAVGVSN
jgi:uncharacterized protein YlzI (FlbEa/FlbD family)